MAQPNKKEMRMKREISLMVIFTLLILAGVASAEDVVAVSNAAPTLGDAISGVIHKDIIPVLTALILGLIGALALKLKAKWGLDLTTSNMQYIEGLALQGIGYAEEKSAAYAKKAIDNKMEGHEKLAIAVAHIVAAMPSVSEETAERIVHAILAKTQDVGATGEKTITPF